MNQQQNNLTNPTAGLIRYFERVPEATVWRSNGTHLFAYGKHALKHLADGGCTVVATEREFLRTVSFTRNGEAYLEVGCAGTAIAVTANLPYAVSVECSDARSGEAVDRKHQGSEIPVGARKPGGGTNYPRRPEREGQLGVFQSPYSHSSWLVDVAERDAAGTLRWAALSLDDPRYEQAIIEARSPKESGAQSLFEADVVSASTI